MCSLSSYYLNFLDDIILAGRFLNRDNLSHLARSNRGWQEVLEDVSNLEEAFNTTFRPRTRAEREHVNLSSNVVLLRNNPLMLSRLIAETGVLRQSLG